jgi:peptidyl-prolyl cis-trans isomerase SurA
MTNSTLFFRSRGLALCSVLAGGLTLAACSGTGETRPPDNVWATVDGRTIDQAAVDTAYKMVVAPGSTPSLEEMLTVKLNVLDELITQDILLHRATELGVQATTVEIDNALAEQKRSLSDADFERELSARGLSVEDLRESLRRDISAQKLLQREIFERIAIGDDDIAAFYNANRDQFNLTEPHFRLAQILITPVRDPNLQNRQGDDAATADEAKRKADMITQRLQAGGDFAELAMDYSEDPQTVALGGDLGLVPESALANLPGPLANAVSRMEPGTASTFSIGQNYVVLMLISREPAGQRDLGTPAVRDGIRDLLRSRRQQLLQQAFITNLRESADVRHHVAQRIVETQGRLPGIEVPPVAPPPAAESPATDAPVAQ